MTRRSYTVQLMSNCKFTTRVPVVLSCVLFEALVKTCMLHVSEQIAPVGLVHVSIRSSRPCMGVFHMSHYKKQTNRALQSTRLNTQISILLLTLSQFTVITVDVIITPITGH